jgi:hypothetical protein
VSDEHDSWFKNAFGVDLGTAVNKIKSAASAVVDAAKDAAPGTFPLGGSVGRKGKNAKGDVRAVQAALGIPVDGQCGPQTIAAIVAYQKSLGQGKPDGRVDPGGATERAMAEEAEAAAMPAGEGSSHGSEGASPDRRAASGSSGGGLPLEYKGAAPEGELVDALLAHQGALLESLQNAASQAEQEQIKDELEGVNAEISSELWSRKAAEEIERATSPLSTPVGAKEEETSVLSEVVEGDFHEGETTWTGTALNVGVGVVPIVGQIADVRDTAAAAKNLWNDPSWGNAGMLGLAAVGFVPLAGDAAKGGVKIAKQATKKGTGELLEEASQETTEKIGKEASEDLDDEALSKADDAALEDDFNGGLDEGEYATTENLRKGNLGENLATWALAAKGYRVIKFKPSILQTSLKGIDAVMLKDGVVHFIDNKALRKEGKVYKVPALTTNFAKNKKDMLAALEKDLVDATTDEQREVLQATLDAIKNDKYKLVVTNAAVGPDDELILAGVAEKLKGQGIEFVDVFD